MCKNGTNRENPVFYIGLSSDYMAFFASAINILQTLVVAIGAGLAVWGVINLLEGYGNDNPGAKWPVTDDRYLESAIEALDRLAFFD